MIFSKIVALPVAAALFSVASAAPSANANATLSSRATTFSNMLLIILENTNFAPAYADPNLKSFANSGIIYNNWLAYGHPSQPNYIAMTSGSANGVTTDASVTIDVQNIADLLEAKGLTWKSYQENWPGPCYTGTSSGPYYRKHNPFISYKNIQTNPTRCAKIVDASKLATDISSGTTPTFAWYTPNLNNDGHDTGVTFAGNWLKNFLATTPVLTTFDVVMVTFDENAGASPNKVYTAIAGKKVTTAGVTDSTALNHFSLLKTLENNFGLGNLGKSDVTATPFTF
ncbi:hypothetical protein M413DRAFT_446962 [Hebeloma cylindrosporum]|uniref:Phosphoesterase n=1 Tax=Hebeloma cylindrosporum TaxID=76867 RepID=A0A0C2YEJ3_HEBCY|nr:hypothetical protein M413DRAFT_446962 [Hebeloma cylindrosporum h7]